ncbi:hypothetical protein OpiT1DRAFT_05606 [Opitutaceae bacterium TAV1]|nr:hypothetical protein OpiT1DRAFT_05606 [Opitutaceae bacterium TAV1]
MSALMDRLIRECEARERKAGRPWPPLPLPAPAENTTSTPEEGTTKETTPKLGDIVAEQAKPLARWLDARLGTDIEHCGGCRAAQRGLNGGGALPGDGPEQVV